MEKKTNILLYFFVAVALISLLGFFNTYLKFFPSFSKFPFLIHIHFFAFMAWPVLFIIQPILIKKKKIPGHRKLGKLSYFLAPILLTTIVLLFIQQIKREIAMPENFAHITAFIFLIDVVSFSTYFTLAMVKRHNIRWQCSLFNCRHIGSVKSGVSAIATSNDTRARDNRSRFLTVCYIYFYN